LPGFCLARAALDRQSMGRQPQQFLKGLLAAAVALGLICNKDPLGEKLYTLSLWYGIVTWQALILLVGCLLVYHWRRSTIRSASALDKQWMWSMGLHRTGRAAISSSAPEAH